MDSILLGLLSKTLKMTEDELKSLINKEDSDELKDDALQILLDKDAARITAIKESFKDDKDAQYKRGQREKAEEFERKIKSQFNIEADLTGDELIAEAVKTTSGTGEVDGELTDEKVKAHPLYQQLQRDKKKEIDTLTSEFEEKIKNAESDFNTKMTKSEVRRRAIELIRAKNPKLPEDAQKALKRLSSINPELDNYSYELDGNNIIVKNSDGSQLTDAHNNPVSFAELVGTVADDYFDFADPEDDKNTKGGTDNKNDFNKNRFNKVKAPTSPEELKDAMRSAKTTEEREAISQAYEEANKVSN